MVSLFIDCGGGEILEFIAIFISGNINATSSVVIVGSWDFKYDDR